MILAELLDLTGLAQPNAELVFDDHGSFRALTQVRLDIDSNRIVFVLEAHQPSDG